MTGQGDTQARCTYGCGRAVPYAGYACWRCQEYIEYLTAEHCECPHDVDYTCRCRSDCEEDCPAYARERWLWRQDASPD